MLRKRNATLIVSAVALLNSIFAASAADSCQDVECFVPGAFVEINRHAGMGSDLEVNTVESRLSYDLDDEKNDINSPLYPNEPEYRETPYLNYYRTPKPTTREIPK